MRTCSRKATRRSPEPHGNTSSVSRMSRRCLADGLTVEEATVRSSATWGDREPYAHLSSPRGGWSSSNTRAHADYIDPADFPDAWLGRTMTVDIEAKAKERAVLAIKEALGPRPGTTSPTAGPRTRIRTRASAPGASP